MKDETNIVQAAFGRQQKAFGRQQKRIARDAVRSGAHIFSLGQLKPEIGPDTFLGKNATLVGNVKVGRGASVWFSAIVRGDNGPVVIGDESNIQDLSMLHSLPGMPMTCGHRVSVGHQAILHGCTIGDSCLIGMNAIIMDGAVIGRYSIVAAGSVIPRNKVFEDGVVLQGTPARIVRACTDEDLEHILRNALEYIERTKRYLRDLKPL
jgi:carbonic anhydrase/acetyltransferase-like protein (isoleucine patch superfamily)